MPDEPTELTTSDRVVGALLGLATGDALGAPLEFMSREQIQIKHGTVREMIGGGWLSLRPGEGTDETSLMEVCATACLESEGFDPKRIAEGYLAWYRRGPVDVANTMRMALAQMELGDDPETAARKAYGVSETESDDNSTIVRSLPLGILFRDDPERLCETVLQESRLTHWDLEPGITAAMANLILAALLRGQSREAALTRAKEQADAGLCDIYDVLPDFDYVDRADVQSTRRATDTLTAAIHFFLETDDPEECLVELINEGGDADTAAAIAGAFAGAHYGPGALPKRWVNRLRRRGAVVRLARKLDRLAREQGVSEEPPASVSEEEAAATEGVSEEPAPVEPRPALDDPEDGTESEDDEPDVMTA